MDLGFSDKCLEEKAPIRVDNFGSNVSELFQLQSPYSLIVFDSQCEDRSNMVVLDVVSPGCHLHDQVKMRDDSTRPLHRHNFLELMFVFEGDLIQHIEDTSYHYSKGSCCLLNRNTRHREEYSTRFKVAFLSLTDEFMQGLSEFDVRYSANGTIQKNNGEIQRFIRSEQNRANCEKEYLDFIPSSANPDCEKEIDVIFGTLGKETAAQRPGFLYFAKGLILRLFSILGNPNFYQLTHFSPDSGPDDFLYARIAHFIEARHGRVSRAELERALNYSGDYLNRVMKKYSGMTLVEYGLDVCLKDTARLLRATDESISDIMKNFGFSNRTYFNKIFKDKYGVTPKRYRES